MAPAPGRRSLFSQLFHEFLLDQGGAEDVNAVYERARLAGSRADYMLRDRSVIIEWKELDDNRIAACTPLLDRYARSLPNPRRGPMSADQLIAEHPKGRSLDARLRVIATGTLGRDMREGNRQIRGTRDTLCLPAAAGILFVVNDRNQMLRHDLLAEEVEHLMNRRRGGNWRFEFIDVVVSISPLQVLAEGPDAGCMQMNVFHRAGPNGDRATRVFGELHTHFSAWLGIPARSVTAGQGAAAVRAVKMRDVLPPIVQVVDLTDRRVGDG